MLHIHGRIKYKRELLTINRKILIHVAILNMSGCLLFKKLFTVVLFFDAHLISRQN